MKHFLKIVGIALVVTGLVMVRAFESELFYDPLLQFFKSDYQSGRLPGLNTGLLLVNTGLRFWLNGVLSILLIWLLFKDRSVVRLSFYLHLGLFLIGLVLFYALLTNPLSDSFFGLFYVRRFLIQPLLLLVLIPAFYFHSRTR
jgi:exosortase F-associated protein